MPPDVRTGPLARIRERGAAILRWLTADGEIRAAEFDGYSKQYSRRGMIRQRLITVKPSPQTRASTRSAAEAMRLVICATAAMPPRCEPRRRLLRSRGDARPL